MNAKNQVERIKKFLPEEMTAEHCLYLLASNGLIKENALQDFEIFDHYKKLESTGKGKTRSVDQTSRDLKVSPRRVYYSRKRFEDD